MKCTSLCSYLFTVIYNYFKVIKLNHHCRNRMACKDWIDSLALYRKKGLRTPAWSKAARMLILAPGTPHQ